MKILIKILLVLVTSHFVWAANIETNLIAKPIVIKSDLVFRDGTTIKGPWINPNLEISVEDAYVKLKSVKVVMTSEVKGQEFARTVNFVLSPAKIINRERVLITDLYIDNLPEDDDLIYNGFIVLNFLDRRPQIIEFSTR